MLGTSRFLVGLLRESSDAVAAQVDLWDRSNVVQAAWEQATKRSQLARDAEAAFKEQVSKPLGQKIQTGLKDLLPGRFGDANAPVADEAHPLDGHVAKLCQLSCHARLRLEHPLDVVQLHDIGLEIERDAVRSLREADNRSVLARLRGETRTGFEGTSIDDLVRHVIQQTFQAMDAEFRKKSPAEQEEIAERIASALRDLPPEEQERIRRAARLPDLTAETLRQTGMLASLGLGVSSLVGIERIS